MAFTAEDRHWIKCLRVCKRIWALGCIKAIAQKINSLILNCLGFLCVPLDILRKSKKYFKNPTLFTGPTKAVLFTQQNWWQFFSNNDKLTHLFSVLASASLQKCYQMANFTLLTRDIFMFGEMWKLQFLAHILKTGNLWMNGGTYKWLSIWSYFYTSNVSTSVTKLKPTQVTFLTFIFWCTLMDPHTCAKCFKTDNGTLTE